MRTGFLKVTMVSSILLASMSFTVFSVDRFSVRSLSIVGDLTENQYADAKEVVLSVSKKGSKPKEILSALSDLPWVGQVSFTKKWSEGGELEIFPRDVIAYWNEDAFISSDGSVLQTSLFQAGKLPYFYGPAGSEKKVIDFYLKVGGVLRKQDYQIKEVKLSNIGAWSVVTTTGVSISLGREKFRARLERFLEVRERLRERGDYQKMTHVDARYPSGVAVQFEDDESQESLSNLVQKENVL